MRSGAELVRATAPFAKEDRALTWRLLATTGALYLAALAGLLFLPSWPLRMLLVVPAGLLIVRLFIFYHDHLHGAILVGSPVGRAIMRLVGYWVLSGPSVWKQTHDYHHQHTAKMVGAAIGSYPVVTTDMWAVMTPLQRRAYRLIRHPLNMVFGYVTVFLLGMCLSPLRRDPKRHYDGLIAPLVHFGAVAAVGLTLGWATALVAIVAPLVVACAAGSYLFYAQHNFPGMELKDRREWEYSFAALHSSSMMDMPGWMHWFTGNIGYHHVHHLNHRIPFYRLPEAMAAVPELQNPHRTSLAPRDVFACLRLALWDPRSRRMLSFDEAQALPAR